MPPQPLGEVSPHQRLAATLEAVFARQGRSLTSEGTAVDFLIALGEFRKLLQGAREQGLLTEDQHTCLDGMVEGMEMAPGLLAGHHG